MQPPNDAGAAAGDAALLAEVYAAPDDDGPRLVYADALLQRGDPRGELIALQIASARGTITDEGRLREIELITDTARRTAWAQPLSAAGDCEFERGFPATIELRIAAEPDLDHPAWATITGVRGIAGLPEDAAVRFCELPNLRSVETLTQPLLMELCRKPRRWTHVGFSGARPPVAKRLAALPELRSLALYLERAPAHGHLSAYAVRELKLFVDGHCEALDLPPDLERLDVGTRGAVPQMDLARLAHLEQLRLEYTYPSEPLALPSSLKRLHLEGGQAPLPGGSIAGLPALQWAQLQAHSIEAGALRELTSLEELDLITAAGPFPAGALDALVQLRKLMLVVPAALPPRVLARLSKLEELYVNTDITTEPQLDGLPIRRLTWCKQPLDWFPAGLPLQHVGVTLPPALDELERFLARFPALEHLSLELRNPTELDAREAAPWRRFAAILERSDLRGCFIGGFGDWISIERDADGQLSRLRLANPDVPAAEVLARSLTRVTSIECGTAKLPRRLARLVR